MSAIRAKNTKPELIVRRAVFAAGFRYRLHDVRLPGKPDLVFPKYHAVIQIHGCFWHGHDCPLFKWPETNAEFWHTKIKGNTSNDLQVSQALEEQGWRVLTIWECALKGRRKLPLSGTLTRISDWLTLGQPSTHISRITLVSELVNSTH